MFHLLALAILLTTASGAAAQDSALDSLDLRRETMGWEAVGRLDLGAGGFCSGTLVAPDLVLTAAHCLVDPATGERRDPRRITFRAGLGTGGPVAERPGRRAVLHPDYGAAANATLARVRHDAALVKLATPIASARAAPFGTGRAGRSVSLVSYARGRSEIPSRQRRCRVLARERDVLALSCRADHGASGAPVFTTGEGRARIAAIVSRGGTRGGERTTLGPAAGPALAALKKALRTGNGVFPPVGGEARRLSVGEDHRNASGAKFVRP